MTVTAELIARRFLGQKEISGPKSNPLILGMLQHAGQWPTDDSVPWCSAFVWNIAWLLDLPRPEHAALAARSWLRVGTEVKQLEEANVGFDIVILRRGEGGHVGFFEGVSQGTVTLLGGNQNDSVSVAAFDKARVIGVRRLA